MTGRRRVTVGHAPDGSSVVVADERVPEVVLTPRGSVLAVLWGRDDVADLPCPVPVAVPDGYLPPPGGWRASILTFPPDDFPGLPPGEGVVLPDMAAQMQKGGGRGMHTTATIDIVVVLDGELVLEAGDGTEVTLAAGDSVVQHGTHHGWRNRTSAPATIVVFMAGAVHHDA